ncbi:uncharacterized protein LOC132038278 [Lycium ferocissimum]|uniref:uncharacterized protein LOC132038278 n=1 Tax=Lycium ferocissimum TaxID=112874 RepID=UPI00281644B9|nr:uncharacterized protein LOC132038278 [Lycium ferocissimum]
MDDSILEEREELMVALVDEQVKPIFRVAHFLKPTIYSAEKLPFLPSRSKISCSSLKVQFRGVLLYMNGWYEWVDELKPLYEDIWKKAGIFEAIIASTFEIYRHNDLILAFAERWCLETNTFILPWGESTITLEDMVVLGGFSVLGHCVLKPVKTKDSVEVEKTLCEAHKVIRASKGNIVSHHDWMEYFAGKGDHLEHVAFLTLWLSRYVLPARCYRNVQQALFRIAIYLSQGIPIALAPAVLASIYRDLNLLKKLIISEQSSNSRCIEDESNPIIRAPLYYVQLWAWERFVNLQPKPSVIYCGEPRVARWHKVKKQNCVDPRHELDDAAECFLWRPYAIDTVKNWDTSKYYKEREEYVVVGPKMGREILIFTRLIRASELVGMDCVEQYSPHRVSMQFGFDQDVPGCVNHSWRDYDRPIKDANLYIPSRLFESDVSSRYLEWWKNQNVAPEDAAKTHERMPRMSWGHHGKMNASVCCEFLQKGDEVSKDGSFQDCEMRAVESSPDDDNIPISESLRKRKLIKKESTLPGSQEPVVSTQSRSSSASNDGTARERETILESKPLNQKLETSKGKSEELDEHEAHVVKEMVPLESKDKNDKDVSKLNLPDNLELASKSQDASGRYAEFSSKTSVEAPKTAKGRTNITEGNMETGNTNNHENVSSRYEMTDILKLEMRIRNLENINAGKGVAVVNAKSRLQITSPMLIFSLSPGVHLALLGDIARQPCTVKIADNFGYAKFSALPGVHLAQFIPSEVQSTTLLLPILRS